ncbi:hypothetical protein HG826_05280 [Streptomyces sp. GMY01]|uniref:hypothetical protein n=1 Tax=Streptomyces sp. GMY02 TaxID=1333528 RepID=UPI0013AAA449|nr:hypothetical protein [Streptomyces sp. GMY02]MYS44354.1 hypothetical protein [Streptomyces sp. SID5998]NMO33002.1 hypothetical protein [Streptomyces sp. GMY02]
MRIVSVALQAQGDPAPATGICPLLHDLLWAHATPDIRMEHVRVRPTAAGLEAVLFVSAASDARARADVQKLIDHVRRPIAAHGYTVLALPAADRRTDGST